MWPVVRDESLNSAKLYESVQYTSYLDKVLEPELRDRYLETTKQVLKDLAALKSNVPYCQFVSEEIGFDLIKGFEMLKGGPMEVHIIVNNADEFYDGATFQKRGDFYMFELVSSPHSLKKLNNNSLRTVIGHEVGHHLLYASVDAEEECYEVYNHVNAYKAGYSDDYKKNWALELAADKISVASNLQNNIGGQLGEEDSPNAWWNRLYQKGVFPQSWAKKIGQLCKARDEMIIANVGKDHERGCKLNERFNMNCTMTHPAAIYRAVEAEEFAVRARNFLKNQNS